MLILQEYAVLCTWVANPRDATRCQSGALAWATIRPTTRTNAKRSAARQGQRCMRHARGRVPARVDGAISERRASSSLSPTRLQLEEPQCGRGVHGGLWRVTIHRHPQHRSLPTPHRLGRGGRRCCSLRASLRFRHQTRPPYAQALASRCGEMRSHRRRRQRQRKRRQLQDRKSVV